MGNFKNLEKGTTCYTNETVFTVEINGKTYDGAFYDMGSDWGDPVQEIKWMGEAPNENEYSMMDLIDEFM